MAVSSQNMNWVDYRFGISREMGWGLEAPGLTADNATLMQRLLDEGYDMARNPPHLPGQRLDTPTHQWRWMYPWTTIMVWPAPATDVITLSVPASPGYLSTPDTTEVLASAALFHPSMVRQNITDVNGTDWMIVEFLTTTTVRVAGDATSGTPFSSWSIAAGQYGMADDFDGIESPLSEASPTQSRTQILITGEHQIRRERNTLINRTGWPRFVAFVPRYVQQIETKDATLPTPTPANDTTAVQHRWDMVMTPDPNADYTLKLKHRFRVEQLNADNRYPPGGQAFGRVVLAACLARAELERFKTEGPRWDDFWRTLAAAMAEDNRAVTQEYVGPMWQGRDGVGSEGLLHNDTSLVVQVNGVDP